MREKRFWISWISETPIDEFEYHGPWWVSGYDADDNPVICAAVVAEDAASAEGVAYACYDSEATHLNFRFCTERADNWEPFCDRFQRAGWMQWPHSLPAS